MAGAQIFHGHDIHDQAGPPGKMLGPLPLAGLRIVLLPSKPRTFPFSKHIVDEILSERRVLLGSMGAMGPWLFGNNLSHVSIYPATDT